MSTQDREQAKLSVLERALAREKRSRKTAEDLLERKSSELYESNQRLDEARTALERKVIERTEALREARDNAVRLMEERTVFLARISHELRTPLNSILGIVQLMLQEESRDSQRRRLVTVNDSGKILLTMINEILDFTKIEAGELSVEAVATNVADIVDRTVAMLTHTASAKGIALYTQKRAGLPEQVLTDPSRLTQILINLLSNAIKFTSEGAVTVDLDVTGDPTPELVLSIKDTGMGVHPDRLENIFQPFTQLTEGKKAHSGGTGLGLAIVQRSVELLEGSVTVQSSLGEGSVFSVRLPLALGDAGALASSAQISPSPKISTPESQATEAEAGQTVNELGLYRQMGASKPLRILVADDNETNRSVMEMQLDFLGYQADYVANGEEVVRAVLAHAYDILLLDISMPLMNGEEASSTIRNMIGISQPVIVAVTASALKGDRERYLDGGMDHYLPKPVDSLDLAKILFKVGDARAQNTQPSAADDQSKKLEAPILASADSPDTLIDLEELTNRLGEMLEPMLMQVSPIFLAELPHRMQRLRDSWERKDTESVISILHALKGSAASTGASAMTALCGALEVRCRSNEFLVSDDIDKLTECVSSTAEALKLILSEFNT